MDVIEEYIQSLESIYTADSYDLFLHNCNNFTQDLSVFLLGKSIPNEISSLPETFLRTPMGQMLRGQIDQSMRRMTQAPDALAGTSVRRTTTNGTYAMNGTSKSSHPPKPTFFNGKQPKQEPGHVYNVTDSSALRNLLRQASNSCAIIFFTSATCPPCKLVYPAYDELAYEAGDKAIFVKIDISQAYGIASQYSVRATPTFKTFMKGKEDDTWSGAKEAQLRGNVQLLLQMAHAGHSHSQLNLPSFWDLIESPIMYNKMPPLDKLVAKLGDCGNDPRIQRLVTHIKTREAEGMASSAVPDLHALSSYVASAYTNIPMTNRFALVDLFRIACTDTRVSSFISTEDDLTILRMLTSNVEWVSIPYQLRLVICQLLCNLFSSPVFQEELCKPNSKLLDVIQSCGISDCLIAENSNAQQAAAALFYNLAAVNHNQRVLNKPNLISISEDVEASLACAVDNEGANKDTLHSLLLALGMMLYGANTGESLWELCQAMDLQNGLQEKEKIDVFRDEKLIREVGREMLGKGGLKP